MSLSMASDDLDREEFDRLVQELAAPPQAAVTPGVVTRTTAAATEVDAPGAMTPGRRWTTARLLMPAARTEPTRLLALATAINLRALPALPALPKFAAPPEWQSSEFAARVFVGLGVLLSAAMPHWPYANAWSWGLLSYLSAILLVVVTGIWGAKLTWDARMPAAHTVAVGTVLWGLGLLAAEAVPRIGLA
jgi:hypothetical protein